MISEKRRRLEIAKTEQRLRAIVAELEGPPLFKTDPDGLVVPVFLGGEGPLRLKRQPTPEEEREIQACLERLKTLRAKPAAARSRRN